MEMNGKSSAAGMHKSGQAPFRAYSSARRRALCFDCLDTASCPRRTLQVAGHREAFHFVGETKREMRRDNPFQFRAQCAALLPSSSNSNF